MWYAKYILWQGYGRICISSTMKTLRLRHVEKLQEDWPTSSASKPPWLLSQNESMFPPFCSGVSIHEYGWIWYNNSKQSFLEPTWPHKNGQTQSTSLSMVCLRWNDYTHFFAVVGTLRQFCPVSAYHWHPIILHQLTSGYLPKSFALASDVYLFWSLGQL